MQNKCDMHSSLSLQFFSLIQKKFYAEGKDPKVVSFYTEICEELGLDFIEFKKIFELSDAVNAVNENFMRCRKLGVRSFPSILLQKGNDLKSLSVGYISAKELINKLKNEVLKIK
ncbi:hypothetical protein [Acinetobacter guillouiae]|uniref:hypothetical protein n=1 Tax=Acinetobacter guillouiae TaxID=106649 RepID=UPI00300B97DD